MRRQIISIILWRELRDQLRDRRTLFVVVVLPLVFYPLLAIGLVQLTDQFERQDRMVGIINVDQLPTAPALFDQETGKFLPRYFEDIEDFKDIFFVDTSRKFTANDLRDGKIDTLVEIPPDAREKWNRGETVILKVLKDGRRDSSSYSYRFLRVILKAYAREMAADNMEKFGKRRGYGIPILVPNTDTDVVPKEKRSGSTWGRIIPFFLVIMALTGAFYPAIDMIPGEKERGTMESLLLSPATRQELVVGKYLTILIFSLVTVVTNLISICITMLQVSSVIRKSQIHMAERLAAPELWKMGVSLLFVIPLAAFFAALCVTLATFARTTKEGQHYLMPLFMVVTPLTALTLAPGIELSPVTSLIPVTNVGLLIRSLLINQPGLVLQYSLPVLLLTALYCYLAITLAVDQFKREEILFGSGQREAGRVKGQTGWFVRQELPTVAWAGIAWLLGVLLAGLARAALLHMEIDAPWWVLGAVLPALIIAWTRTRQPARSLGLLPAQVSGVTVIALVLAVLSFAAAASIRVRLFPNEIVVLSFGSLAEALGWIILPAVCVEILMRGFVLTGLRDRLPPGRSILLAALLATAGGFEMLSPLIVLVLSVVLGIVVTRTGSIWPAVTIHLAFRAGWLLPSLVAWPDNLALITTWALGISLLAGWLTQHPSLELQPENKSNAT